MLEESRLFERSIGVTSDIVHKEMYTFEDRNEQSVSLRPEGTASVVRACIEHNLLYDQPRKFYYLGSMFRRERPQKGRLRQFHQFGMECLGYDEPYADVEQLMFIHDAWSALGLNEHPTLVLNYIGERDTRHAYAAALKDYYSPYLNDMDDLHQRRWHENTMRLLDSKDPLLVKINREAPSISRFYSQEEQEKFSTIQSCCHMHNIPFTIEDNLMRGLDYYSGLIYEWKSDHLGAQSTVCGGGRYDLLFESLGEKRQSACGFSIGMERLIALYPEPQNHARKVIHIASESAENLAQTLALADKLRRNLGQHAYFSQLKEGKSSNLVKRALRKNADILLIVEHNYRDNHSITVKNLKDKTHQAMHIDELAHYLESKS